METLREALAKIKGKGRAGGGDQIDEWKKRIPQGSRWHPNDPGNPSCKLCEGTGYVKLDVAIGHPYFGKILLCSCVDQSKIAQSRAAA